MKRRDPLTRSAPASIGPYSAVFEAGSMVYCSGQLPIDPATGDLVASDIEAQTSRVFMNMEVALGQAGCTLDDIVKTTVYLRDLDDFADMNRVYEAHLGNRKPARTSIGGVDLPKGARIEIEAVALRGESL